MFLYRSLLRDRYIILLDNRMEDKSLKKQHRNVAKILSFSIVFGMLAVSGCSNRYTSAKNDSKSLAVTIGEDKIYMDTIKPFIAKAEITSEYYNQMYMQYR